MTDLDEKSVRLVLSCLRAESCAVIFEPFGAEYALRSDDDIHVEIAGPGSGEVLVWHHPEALTITPWVGGDYVSVITASGQQLAT